MKTYKEICTLVLKEYENGTSYGLCFSVWKLKIFGTISDAEGGHFIRTMNLKNPFKYLSTICTGGFLWHYKDKNSRIKGLKKQIL